MSNWLGEFLSDYSVSNGKPACVECGVILPESSLKLKSEDRVCRRCRGEPGILDKQCSCGKINPITAKACHSCGSNFHRGGGGKGGGGGIKTVNKPGGVVRSASVDPKWAKSKGDVHMQNIGANVKLTAPDGKSTTRYVKFDRYLLGHNHQVPPPSSGSWSFRVGNDEKSYHGTRDSAFIKAAKDSVMQGGSIDIHLLP